MENQYLRQTAIAFDKLIHKLESTNEDGFLLETVVEDSRVCMFPLADMLVSSLLRHLSLFFFFLY